MRAGFRLGKYYLRRYYALSIGTEGQQSYQGPELLRSISQWQFEVTSPGPQWQLVGSGLQTNGR
jgi:hypothetical protein